MYINLVFQFDFKRSVFMQRESMRRNNFLINTIIKAEYFNSCTFLFREVNGKKDSDSSMVKKRNNILICFEYSQRYTKKKKKRKTMKIGLLQFS